MPILDTLDQIESIYYHQSKSKKIPKIIHQTWKTKKITNNKLQYNYG